MRFDGRLTQWNDERGFGFIEPTQGGDKVFVHISAFARADRDPLARPQVGERLSFEIERDANGRKQARRVTRPDAVGLAQAGPLRDRRDPGRRPTRSAQASLAGRLIAMLVTLAIVAGLGWQGYQWWAAHGPGRSAALQSVAAPNADEVRTPAPATAFQCDGRQHCSQMTSCAEAKFFLRHCPGVKMDGNNDGVPCEQQWCTSAFAK